MDNPVLQAALRYAEIGWCVFPCKPGEKKPLHSGWQDEATCDPERIKSLFSNPSFNIGWAIPEDHMVLDIDFKDDKDGFKTLDNLERIFSGLDSGPNQETPSGGNHLVFSLGAATVPNSVGKIGIGLDVRSAGGYIVLAPSNVGGRVYDWGSDDPFSNKTPPAPAWLIDLAVNGRKKGTPVSSAIFGEGERNAGLASIAGSMRKRGMGQGSITAALLEENRTRCVPPLPDNEVRTIAESIAGYAVTGKLVLARAAADWRSAIDSAEDADQVLAVAREFKVDDSLSRTSKESLLKAAAKAAGVRVGVLRSDLNSAPTARGGAVLPVVDVTKSDFAMTVDAGARVLGSLPEIFQRGGALAEVVSIPERGETTIQPIMAPRLAYLLARGARWRYGDSGDGAPPPDVVASLMAQSYWPGVRPLAGLLHQPTISQSGKMLGSGYDPESMRLPVFNPEAFPAYAGTAAEALAELRGLLTGFVWASPLDEAAALGAVLTAAIRPTLATAPAFLISAPEMGSGKTYLAQIIGEFAGGACLRRWPRQEDEAAKALFAALLEGRPGVLFDNLSANWQGESLAAALTSPTYTERTLGQHRSIEVSTACLLLATGNNVKAVSDLARRVVTIQLDPRMEAPASRSFDFDPLAEVQAHRGEWVMKALRIIEGWIQAGRPEAKVSTIGSFGQWGGMVRQPLLWLGLPDPGASLMRGMGDDPNRELLNRLIVSWDEGLGGEPVTVRGVIKWASLRPNAPAEGSVLSVLQEVAEERGEINVRKVGLWLSENARRVSCGLRLEQGERGRHGHLWRVVRV
jgi:hypothetical protein